MSFQLLRAVLSGVWMMDPTEAEKYLPLVARLIAGDFNLEGPKEEFILPEVANAVAASSMSSGEPTREGLTAVIPIMGPILKYSQPCGPQGLDRISQQLAYADQNPNINSILYLIDSGGGQASGVQSFVERMKESTKPSLALIHDGVGASAAYWIATGANQGIWASTKTSVVGSIGTMITLADMRPKLEKDGIKVHEIYATKSTKKNKSFMEALDGKYKTITDELLDPFNETFHASVKESRGDKIKSEGVFSGETYMATTAIENGLIDRIGNIQEAVNHLQSIVKSGQSTPKAQSNQSSTNNLQSMKFKSALTAILAVLGFASVKSEEESPLVTEERLETLNASLETAMQTISGHEATIAQLRTDLQLQKDNLATAEADRDKYKADAEKFGKQAGSSHVPPKKEKAEGGNQELSAEETTALEIANLPHNRVLDANPLFN